jgi:transformer-2 protein
MAMGMPLSAAAAAGEDSNLFVTGIHPCLTEEEITVLFEKHGRVEKCNSPGHGATTESVMATGMRLSASAAAAAAVIDGLVLLSIESPWP